MVGEGTVKVSDRQNQRHIDKENYIDFKMRLLGEPGTFTVNGDERNGNVFQKAIFSLSFVPLNARQVEQVDAQNKQIKFH